MEPPLVRRRSTLTAPVRLAALGLGGAGGAAALAACGAGDEDAGLLTADVERQEPGPVAQAGPLAVPFSARLLAAADRSATNLVCSPLSAQIALTMAALGAAGTTREQMEDVLGAGVEELAEAANALSAALAEVGEDQTEEDSGDDAEPDTASLADGVWVSERLIVREDYLESLARHLGAGAHAADFVDERSREQARRNINAFVEKATDSLIEELIGEGVLAESTVIVLVNALHLAGSWGTPLLEPQGEDPFTRADGSTVPVGLLRGTTTSWYEDELCRATLLGTRGGLGLALVQPVAEVGAVLDGWAQASADPTTGLGALLTALAQGDGAEVQLALPAFSTRTSLELGAVLEQLGMTDAFAEGADFSGMADDGGVVLSEVLQQAVIMVDEHGMEAAAATAVLGSAASGYAGEPHELVLDRPFLYVACHVESAAPLVIGWIGDPTAEEG